MPSLSSSNDVSIKVSTSADNKGIDEAKSGLKSISNQADDTGSKFSGMGTAAKIAVAAIGASVIAVGKTFVQSAADLQQTSKSFEVLTGNVEIANGLFAQLATYANSTPFEFPDIAKAGQTLLGFGISSDKVYGDIQTLGDIAAATGADFGSLALVFSQVNATGKLMGQDALQLINNKIPIFNILGKKMGITAGEVKKKMEAGAIGVDLFNEALVETTQKGGFAFKGVDTLAQSFNGRMSTLSDSVLDFGRNLLGVKVDNKLGLVIEKGGLFDQLSNALPKISDGLKVITPVFSGVISGLILTGGKVFELGQALVDYLLPHFEGLTKSIQDNLIPTLDFLWRNIIEPLIPIIGVTLAVAIGAVTDSLKLMIDSWGWLVTKFQEGNPWVIAAVIAFSTLATAMAFNAVFNALTTGFGILTGTIIPGVILKVTALQALITSPLAMGSIAVAGALADIALVMAAVVAVMNAIDAMNNAAKAKSDLAKTNANIKSSAEKAYAQGNKSQGDKLMSIANDNKNNAKDPSWFDQFITGSLGKFSSGGYTGSGASNEVAGIVHRGEYVVPKSQVDQSTGMPNVAGGNNMTITIQQLILDAGGTQEFFQINDRDAQMRSMKLSTARGQ